MWKALSFVVVSLLLASSVNARQGALRLRVGDAVRGPVESVRVEVSDINVAADGQTSEGPRRLAQTKTYSPDGKRSEKVVYDRGGARRERTIQVYDDRGELAEFAVFDAGGALIKKFVYVRRGDETAVYDGEGQPQEVVVLSWNEQRNKILEIKKYDGNGALAKRQVNTRDGDDKKSTWDTYGPGGDLVEKSVHDLNYDGPKRHEQTKYNADGTVAGGHLSTADTAMSEFKSVTTDPNGEPLRRQKVTRELDSHRNLVRYVNYRWNHERGDFEPYRVAYHVIKYRE
jgi:antitoxin component YwqK of YwqJK toxin-antitoxin module